MHIQITCFSGNAVRLQVPALDQDLLLQQNWLSTLITFMHMSEVANMHNWTLPSVKRCTCQGETTDSTTFAHCGQDVVIRNGWGQVTLPLKAVTQIEAAQASVNERTVRVSRAAAGF